jgi:hypothetical protein
MNIEHVQEAVEAVLERRIDSTVWDRFARAGDWEYEVIEVIAQLFEDAEPDINSTLAELDADHHPVRIEIFIRRRFDDMEDEQYPVMSLEDWEEIYDPDGLFETDDPLVAQADAHHVWTQCQGDGPLEVYPGFHWVD